MYNEQNLEKTLNIITICSVLVVVMCVVYVWGYRSGKNSVQTEAISLGYAIYNPTNSDWQWK